VPSGKECKPEVDVIVFIIVDMLLKATMVDNKSKSEEI